MKHSMIQTKKQLKYLQSSNDLDKYKYLTSEDLDYKPDAVKQVRFEYSPLGKIFNKGLKKTKKKDF